MLNFIILSYNYAHEGIAIFLQRPPTDPGTPPTLPSGNLFFYTPSMDNITTGFLLVLSTIVIYALIVRWWRHRRAAKLADKLLAEVIRGKDAFRR